MGSQNSKIQPEEPIGRHKEKLDYKVPRHSRDNSIVSINTLPVVKEIDIEESTENVVEKSPQNDTQDVPNGDIQPEVSFMSDADKRQSTLSTLKPESEVSIVISNPSDDDGESVHYTVQERDIHQPPTKDVNDDANDDVNDDGVTENSKDTNNKKMGSNASINKGTKRKDSDNNNTSPTGNKTPPISDKPSSKNGHKPKADSKGDKKTNRNSVPNDDVVKDAHVSNGTINGREGGVKRNSIIKNGDVNKPRSPDKRVTITSPDVNKDADDFYNRLSKTMGKKGYLKIEPSLELFDKAFKEYLDMACDPPTDDQGIIIPSPPLTRKSELLKSEDLKTTDLYSSMVPEHMMNKSLERMVQYLVKPAGSNIIEKVRALFVWLVTTDSIPEEDADSREEDEEKNKTVRRIIQEIKEDKLTHSMVFRDMCKIAGILCRDIDGISRGFVEQPSTVVTETITDTWSAVVINDSWRLIDVSRAARIYSGLKKAQSENPKNDDNFSNFDKRQSPITDLLDFYFLTDPDVFVFSHFPDEENFQFLPRPVNYSEFTYLPYLKPHFFILGFREGHMYESVQHAVDGTLEMEWNVPEGTARRVACKFHRVENKSPRFSTTNDLRDYIYLESDMKSNCFRAKVNVPSAGIYVLEINGRDGNLAYNKNSGLCSYVIKCSENVHYEPYIENDREEWGPGSDCQLTGVKPVSHHFGEVRLTKGEGLIEFDMSSPLNIVHTLSHITMTVAELSNYVIHRIENDKIFIHIRVPKAGEYALKIFSRKENATGVFVNICTYLVIAPDDIPTDKDLLPFPKVDDGLVGVNKQFKKLKMELVNPKTCIIYSPPSGYLKLKINLAPNVHYLPEFKLCIGNNETPMHEYTTWGLLGLMGTFRLRFPQQGMYLFSLYAILPDRDDQVNVVYNAVIICNWPSERCFPYPSSLASWTPHYKLISPKDVYLCSESKVKFLADIPDASKVFLKGKLGWQHLEKREDGMWENDIRIEPGQENMPIKMFASIEEGSDSYFSLLQFKVISRQEMRDMEELQKKHYKQAMARVDTLKETGEWNDPEIIEEKTTGEEPDDGLSQILVDEQSHDITASEDNSDVDIKEERKTKLRKKKHRSEKKLDTKSHTTKTRKRDRSSPKKRKKVIEVSTDTLSSTDPEPAFTKEYSADSSSDSDSSTDSEQEALLQKARRKREDKDKKRKELERRGLREQLIINRLKGAVKRWDKLELIRALEDWKQENFKDKKHYRRGMQKLEIITLRDDLITHLTNRNLPSLKSTLDIVIRKGYAHEIPYEVSKARARISAADSYMVVHHRNSTIDVQTLAEIRSYVRPPRVVHRIVVAMLLLMGTPEKNTKTWKRCKKRLVVFGRNGLNSRLHEIEPGEIHQSIAARTTEMLHGHTTIEADCVSPGVGALFFWVKQITEAVLAEHDKNETVIKPAHKKEQKRLLREATELSIDGSRYQMEPVESEKTYVLREKTESHFRTRERVRRDTKKGLTLTLDVKASQNRSRSKSLPAYREKAKGKTSRDPSPEKKDKSKK